MATRFGSAPKSARSRLVLIDRDKRTCRQAGVVATGGAVSLNRPSSCGRQTETRQTLIVVIVANPPTESTRPDAET